VDPDLDDTQAAPLGTPSPSVVPPVRATPDLDDTVIPHVASTAVRDIVEPHVEPSWPQPAWPAALDAVPRPTPVYSIRIGFDSAPVRLDTTVFVGRKPVEPRIPGVVHPRLITVASPRSEVSGTHLEIRQHGSSVIVTDLRSTNGSVVVIPGSAPRRMRQGESIVVSPGTFVDIGDGNLIEILATRLRYDEGAAE
jgi:hypothetical protein